MRYFDSQYEVETHLHMRRRQVTLSSHLIFARRRMWLLPPPLLSDYHHIVVRSTSDLIWWNTKVDFITFHIHSHSLLRMKRLNKYVLSVSLCMFQDLCLWAEECPCGREIVQYEMQCTYVLGMLSRERLTLLQENISLYKIEYCPTVHHIFHE